MAMMETIRRPTTSIGLEEEKRRPGSGTVLQYVVLDRLDIQHDFLLRLIYFSVLAAVKGRSSAVETYVMVMDVKPVKQPAQTKPLASI